MARLAKKGPRTRPDRDSAALGSEQKVRAQGCPCWRGQCCASDTPQHVRVQNGPLIGNFEYIILRYLDKLFRVGR